MDYSKIGKHIHLIDNRNTDLAVDKLVGLTVDKKFIPSVANIIGTDLSRYKIIRKNQFACSLMQVSRDGKMPVAMFKDDVAIMSPAYPMFEVNNEEELMPEYLMMYLSRPEFDREAVFYAIGGVRGSLEWEDVLNMPIPVPPIEEQRRIVSEYQTVERRIQNNELLIKKLEETAQAIYHHTFVEGIDEENLPEGWRKGCLSDVANICSGKDHKELADGEIPVYGSGGMMRKCNNYLYKGESVLIPRKGTLNNIMYVNEAFWTVDTLFYTIMKIDNVALYLYYSIKDIDFLAQDSGTSVPSNTSKELNILKLLIPSANVLKRFDYQCLTIHKHIILLIKENYHLRTLQSLLTSKLS